MVYDFHAVQPQCCICLAVAACLCTVFTVWHGPSMYPYIGHNYLRESLCACVCVRACMRACVCECVCSDRLSVPNVQPTCIHHVGTYHVVFVHVHVYNGRILVHVYTYTCQVVHNRFSHRPGGIQKKPLLLGPRGSRGVPPRKLTSEI